MFTSDAALRPAALVLSLAMLVLASACAVDHEPSVLPPIDRSILDDPARPEEERAQDADRKALEVYDWLGIRAGMVVADVFASGGYNTHLLSRVVGERGKVHSVLEFYADPEAMEGRIYRLDDLKKRVQETSLDNVDILIHIGELPQESIDAAVIVRNYHDVEWVFENLKRDEVVANIYRALKPGGVIGVVDVATDGPGWQDEVHRLNESLVIEDFARGGFELVERSDMLSNPEDDHSTSGFEVGRHKMDRYLLKFRKPQA